MVGLGFSLIVASYLIFRFQALQTSHAVLAEQLQNSETDLRGAKPMRPSSFDNAKLRDEITDYKEKSTQAQRTLEGFENGFIDLSRSDAEASMRKQITLLASKHRIKMLKITASSMNLTQLAENHTRQNKSVQQDPLLNRRLFDMTLNGHYYPLRDFIEALRGLPHAVVVTRLSFSNETHSDVGGGLKADLTLAF